MRLEEKKLEVLKEGKNENKMKIKKRITEHEEYNEEQHPFRICRSGLKTVENFLAVHVCYPVSLVHQKVMYLLSDNMAFINSMM